MRRPLLHRMTNIIQSIVIIGVLGAILATISWFIAGVEGIIWVSVIWLSSIIVLPSISPYTALSMYSSSELHPWQAPRLFQILDVLSKKAELDVIPKLYYVRSQDLITFTSGSGGDRAIALSDGILRLLDLEELTGVLAHEVAHIQNNDIWIMQMADVTSRIATLLSYVAQVLLVLLVPLWFLEGELFPLLILLSIMFLPLVNVLLQLSLNRIREYDADLGAVMLTEDPAALASALSKIHLIEMNWLSYLNPFAKTSEPSMLRTHPALEKRIERLSQLDEAYVQRSTTHAQRRPLEISRSLPIVDMTPRRRFDGSYW